MRWIHAMGVAMVALACAACGDDTEGTGSASTEGSGGTGGGTGGAGGGSGGGTGGTGGGATLGWEALAPLPSARQETAVVAMDGKILVLGGFNGMGEVLADVAAYDPAADAWSEAVPLPEPLHHINAAVVEGKLYVVGALREITFQATGKVLVFDPAAGTWTEQTPMPTDTERGASAVGVIGTKIYVAGGLRGGMSVSNFSAYDTVEDAWEELPAMPAALDHLVGGVVEGVFYAIGGRSGGIGGITGAVNAFDPEAGAWSPRAPMLTPRGGTAAGILGGRIFVVGGEGNAETASGVFDDNEAYDPASDAWTALAPMQTPRHGTGAVGFEGKLYVPAGATTQAFGAVDTHEVFTP